MEIPLVSSLGEDSTREVPLACHFPASEKSRTALIKHHEVSGTTVAIQRILIPQEMYQL